MIIVKNKSNVASSYNSGKDEQQTRAYLEKFVDVIPQGAETEVSIWIADSPQINMVRSNVKQIVERVNEGQSVGQICQELHSCEISLKMKQFDYCTICEQVVQYMESWASDVDNEAQIGEEVGGLLDIACSLIPNFGDVVKNFCGWWHI